MNSTGATVLLVGDTAAKSTAIRKWLAKTRCCFRVASSFEDACSWLARTDFDLVLSKYQLSDRTAFPLLDWLEGSASSLIFCAKSSQGSRWLPVIEHGERLLHRRCLRATSLPRFLKRILNGRARKSSGGSKVSAESLEQVSIK
jgi:DNA-binding NtrC family response regulator